MSAENCALALLFLTEVIDQKRLDHLPELCSADFSYLSPRSAAVGIPAMKRLLHELHQAFPDLSVTVDYSLANGSLSVIRATYRGTHRAAYGGIAPGGRRIALPVMHAFRSNGDKIHDIEMFFDVQTLLSQISNHATPLIR